MKIHPKRIKAVQNSGNEDLLFLDGLDDCIIGTGDQCAMTPVVIYSVNQIVAQLRMKDGWSEEEAYEFFECNIRGSYTGEHTPIFMTGI
jgi:hypothetical protein